MLLIDKNGLITNFDKIKSAISPKIEHAAMPTVRGIIVHQTGGANAQSALSSYTKDGANGAHFLIDKDGTIYQTASIYKQTWHVGKLKARCMLELNCSPSQAKLNRKYNPGAENLREQTKSLPERFPSNQDSLGIELVGESVNDVYVKVTDAQNASLQWLVAELEITLKIPSTEVFRHPAVSRKNPTEASSAIWLKN